MLLSGYIESHSGPSILTLSTLSGCHSNIRGLSESKRRAIKTCLCVRYGTITLSETFFSRSSTQDLTLSSFHPIVRSDRDYFGGGVAVYIKENMMYKGLLEYENDRNLESIWMQLNTLDGKLLLCIVYRAPDSNEF